MTLADLFKTISANSSMTTGGIVLFAAMTLLQISPLKINPWTWFAGWIGRAINSEVIHKVESLEKELVALRADTKEQSIIDCRTRILQFGDELLQGIHHSKDRFDQTLRDIDAYESYCRDHREFPNNVTVMTAQRIKEVYNQLLVSGDFL